MTFIDFLKPFSLVVLLTFVGCLSYLYILKRAPKLIFSDPVECAEILDCTKFRGVNNRIKRLESRASPNQRLVRAFGINNAFTTTDGKYAREFKAAAVEKIKMKDGDWERVADIAQHLVRDSIGESGLLSTSLDSLVQSIAMRLGLHVLFGRHPLNLDQSAILTLAQAINDCWIISKDTSPSAASPMHIAKATLKDALAKFFPEFGPESDSRDNPLNLILPAYETLWRIVLLCFIEVSFRQSRQRDTAEWRKILGNFLLNPTQAAFERSTTTNTGEGVSVSHVVSEGLRLYPPTRRIHRSYNLKEPLCKPEILAADIEKMQRNPKIWNDPLTFNPSRWSQIGEEARKAFMPFGNKPFICPAQREFGPRMIGILIAALAVCIDPEGLELWYSVGSGLQRTLGDDEEIRTDRDAYESWWVQKK